jgi:hypothetical protein
MWAKRSIVFIICMLGLFLAPHRLFACHEPSEKPKQEEKSCCLDERQHVKDVGTEDCCKDEGAESPKSDHHGDDCGKHCSEKSCRTSLQCNPIVSVIEAQLILPLHADALNAYARYKQPYCADAYFSIWQPPQIA